MALAFPGAIWKIDLYPAAKFVKKSHDDNNTVAYHGILESARRCDSRRGGGRETDGHSIAIGCRPGVGFF